MHLPKLTETKAHYLRELLLCIVVVIFLFCKCHGDISTATYFNH